MEKLIKLLNEYEKLNMCRKFDSFEMHTFENSNGVDRLLEDTVISARYGFIKWLVENDKIEASEIMLDDRMGTIYDKTDSTLMMLAIKDNPIGYLCKIIKE